MAGRIGHKGQQIGQDSDFAAVAGDRAEGVVLRDYSKVSGQFWIGKTGKSLRGDMQSQIVAMYLMTSPHSNMIGVFHCPSIYISHETGSPLEGATKALHRLCEGGFCTYDDDSEMVWVHEMAKFQIGEVLKPTDNRVKDIQKQYANLPEGRIKTEFFNKYSVAYCLENDKPLASPLQAPPKPEAGTEAGTGSETETTSASGKPPRFDPLAALIKLEVPEPVAKDYLALRKAKKAPFTETALKLIIGEAEKAKINLVSALETCCDRGWASFKAGWIVEEARKGGDKSWMFTDKGIEGKAAALGIKATGHDSYHTLKQKCLDRLAVGT